MLTTTDERRPVIAIDIDEVLAQFIPALADFHNHHYNTLLTTQSFVSYEFHNVWGGSKEDCARKMEAFFLSEHFAHRIEPIPHALHVLRALTPFFSFHAVTARQHKIEAATRAWLQRFFPGVFDDVHFGNHYSSSGRSRSKVEMCRMIGAKLLIDDSLVYACQCAQQQMPVLLFGDYPWNRELPNLQQDQSHTGYVTQHGSQEISITVKDFDPHATMVETGCAGRDRTIYRVHSWRDMPAAIRVMLSSSHDIVIPPLPSTAAVADASAAIAHGGDLSLSEPWGEDGRADEQQQPIILDKKQQLRVAVLQLCASHDKAANLEVIRRLVSRAKAAEPALDLVCLPECCVFLGQHGTDVLAAAEAIVLDACGQVDGDAAPSLLDLCQLAKEHGVWLSVGGFPERRLEDPTRVSNTHIVISREGLIRRPVYRKVHLFDCPLVGLHESKWTAPGSELVVLSLEGWNVGLSVCYDLRFSSFYECMHSLVDRNAGADDALDVILVPAAFTVPTGKAHWEVLLRARAIENQCFVVAAAQAGRHNDRRTSYGHSLVVDPWGAVVASLAEETEGLCIATLERRMLRDVRSSMPVQVETRRPRRWRNDPGVYICSESQASRYLWTSLSSRKEGKGAAEPS